MLLIARYDQPARLAFSRTLRGNSDRIVIRHRRVVATVTDSDELYSRIIRELYSPAWLRRSGRDSYLALARKLEIDDETVRRTIVRMREEGFLKGWSAFPNPHVLGMECSSIVFDSTEPTAKGTIISELKRVEGVVAIFNFHENHGLRLVLFHANQADLERKTALVASICCNDPSISWAIPFPACRMKLRTTDWKIMRFLLTDSMRTVSDVARGGRCLDQDSQKTAREND